MSTGKTMNNKSLGYQLKQTQHVMRNSMDNALRPLGLTTPQYAVLSTIERSTGISNAALARESFVTAQTMQGIVSNLEKNSLLKRSSDPDHGRILRTKLTSKGLNIMKQAHSAIAKVEANMTHDISEKNVLLLKKLLSQCAENLV